MAARAARAYSADEENRDAMKIFRVNPRVPDLEYHRDVRRSRINCVTDLEITINI